jgi:hypothetical protein
VTRGCKKLVYRNQPSIRACQGSDQKSSEEDAPRVPPLQPPKEKESGCLTDRSSPHEFDWSEPDWIKELKEINDQTSDTKLALNFSRI